MRKAIITLLLAATATTPLAAQNWQGRGDRGDRQDARQDRGEVRQGQRDIGRDRPVVQPDTRPDQRQWQGRDRPAFQGGLADRRDDRRRDWNDGRRDRSDWNDGRRNGNNGWNGDRRNYGNNGWNDRNDGRWNNGWRNDRRYDWQSYRNTNRNIYRGPRYNAPRGYSYSRWSQGYRVQPFFYSRNYWINDPWAYRLPPAYGDYRWVRYYDDVALVDIRSGLIADIIYSFFW